MVSVALSDCEISSAGTPVLNIHIKPPNHTCVNRKGGRKKTHNPASRSAGVCSDKYNKVQ